MSYNERADGYKGVKYGAGAMAVLGIGFLLKTCGGLAGGLPPSTPMDAEQQLLADPENGELFRTIKRTYPAEFDGLKTEVARRGAEFQKDEDIAAGMRDFMIAAMRRHIGDMAQAPHATLAAYRKAEIALITALQANNIEACGSYFGAGSVNMSKTDPAIRPTIRAFQIKAWEAQAAGRDTPAGRTVAKPAAGDVRTVAEDAMGTGVTETAVNNLLSGVKMPDPTECGAGLALLRGIDALPDAKADNFTAFMASAAR